MHVGAATGALKNTGYQYVAYVKGRAANGTVPIQIPANAIRAAPDVHQAVFASGYGRESQGLYQITLGQF